MGCYHQNCFVFLLCIYLGSLRQQNIDAVDMIIYLRCAITPLNGHMQCRIQLSGIHLFLLALKVFKYLRKLIIMTFSGSLFQQFDVIWGYKVAVARCYNCSQAFWFYHLLENLRTSLILLLVLLHTLLLFLFLLILLTHAEKYGRRIYVLNYY